MSTTRPASIPPKLRAHWLRSAALPIEAIHKAPKPVLFKKPHEWPTDDRAVIVSAIDSHGAIVRRKGCARYFAPLEEIHPATP